MKELPPPVTTGVLYTHFTTVYKLADEQAEKMIASAAKSIKEVFLSGEDALGRGDMAGLAVFAHSLKGLLLNMGQMEWADIARELEQAAKEGGAVDFKEMIGNLKDGVRDLL